MAATGGGCSLKSGERVNWLHEKKDKKSGRGEESGGMENGEMETLWNERVCLG